MLKGVVRWKQMGSGDEQSGTSYESGGGRWPEHGGFAREFELREVWVENEER
jgi:hypothetical protein